jgi:hypothetical protein
MANPTRKMIESYKYAISHTNHFVCQILAVNDAHIALRDLNSSDQTLLSHKQFMDLWTLANEEDVAKELLLS